MSRDVSDQRHDGGLELVEDRLELVGRQPGLGAAQKGVVWTVLETESVGNSPVELDVLLEVRGKKLEVGLAAGPPPMGSGGGSRPGDLPHHPPCPPPPPALIAPRPPPPPPL